MAAVSAVLCVALEGVVEAPIVSGRPCSKAIECESELRGLVRLSA